MQQHRKMLSGITRGLVIRSPWIEKILQGKKIWEIRGRNTKIRGLIGLIKSGSGQVVGTCELKDVIEIFTLDELQRNPKKHRIPLEDLKRFPYKHTFAWVISNAIPLKKPIPYKHPQGAVIWVKLSS